MIDNENDILLPFAFYLLPFTFFNRRRRMKMMSYSHICDIYVCEIIDQLENMGQGNQRATNVTEMSSLSENLDDHYDQFVEIQECCGFQRQRVVKRHLIWQDNLIRNCTDLKSYYKWPQEIAELVKMRKMPRKKYMQEFNDLKYQQKQPIAEEKEILLSPSEIEDFKKNLKKSVLLSYGQAVKPSRPKDNSKIQSVIMTPSRPGTRMRSDMYIEQFRKSTIMKQKNLRATHKSGKSNLRDSIMSFVDDTMSSMFRGQQKQISKQSAHSLQIFIRFTMILQKHLTDPQNKIHVVMQTFYHHLYRTFKKQSLNSVDMEYLTNNVKVFLVLLRDMVEDFYNTRSFAQSEDESFNNFLISNSENILTVVTAIFFKDDRFYRFLFDIVMEFNKEREIQFNKIINSLKGKPPQFFQIKRQYCLNSLTIKKYIEEMSSIDSCIQNLMPEQLESSGDEPYLKCSQCLQGINKTKTPISKMKVIMQCSQKITQSVGMFYSNNSMEVKHDVLDADQILSIFCYLLAIAPVKNLHSHLFMVQHFATDHQLISVTGYYYSVLTCAIEQLEKTYAMKGSSDTDRDGI